MNLAELEHLKNPHLSHLSRSLYMLYLRPLREQGQLLADLYAICNYLAVSASPLPTQPSLKLAETCLNELFEHGLILPSPAQEISSWQNVAISLPLYEAELSVLPQRVFRMGQDWRPSANFQDTCIIAGLSDSSFSDSELKSFVSYWMGTSELRNQAAWERAFAQRLKKQRSAKVAVRPGERRRASILAERPRAETGHPKAEGY